MNISINGWKISAKARLKERTYGDYIEYLKRYVRPKIGKMKLSKLKPLDIQAIYTWMLEKGLSPRTVRYAHSILSSALKQAVKWQILPMNPATMVDLPQKPPQGNESTFAGRSTTDFSMRRKMINGFLFFHSPSRPGMRPEEYLGLRWKNIDLKKKTATIRARFGLAIEEAAVGLCKNRKLRIAAGLFLYLLGYYGIEKTSQKTTRRAFEIRASISKF